jgi:hypothetical protein
MRLTARASSLPDSKNSLRVPCWPQIISCSPAQGTLVQFSEVQAFFGRYFSRIGRFPWEIAECREIRCLEISA